MIDKGFLRIALTIMIIITITVISVGVYLYFNFNSRSSLPVIAPKNTSSFFHFQTRQLRDNYRPGELPYLDTLSKAVSELQIFRDCEEPAEPGIGLYTDLLFFTTPKAKYIAFSLSSESRFTDFLKKLNKEGLVSKVENKEKYNFTFIRNSNWLLAYKYKALVLAKALDTLTMDDWESQLNEIFSGSSDGFIQKPAIQEMYDEGAQIIAWNNSANSNIIHGVKYEGQNIHWVGGKSNKENQKFWGNMIYNQLRFSSNGFGNPVDKDSLLNMLFKRWAEIIQKNPLFQDPNIEKND